MPEQIKILPIEAECPADLLYFLDGARNRPKLGCVWLIAVPGAELIVVVVLDASRRQEAVERLEVLVCRSRPAVQQQHFHRGIVANALRPDLEGPTRSGDGNHPHSATHYI